MKKMIGLATLTTGLMNFAFLSATIVQDPVQFTFVFCLLLLGTWWLTH